MFTAPLQINCVPLLPCLWADLGEPKLKQGLLMLPVLARGRSPLIESHSDARASATYVSLVLPDFLPGFLTICFYIAHYNFLSVSL